MNYARTRLLPALCLAAQLSPGNELLHAAEVDNAAEAAEAAVIEEAITEQAREREISAPGKTRRQNAMQF